MILSASLSSFSESNGAFSPCFRDYLGCPAEDTLGRRSCEKGEREPRAQERGYGKNTDKGAPTKQEALKGFFFKGPGDSMVMRGDKVQRDSKVQGAVPSSRTR